MCCLIIDLIQLLFNMMYYFLFISDIFLSGCSLLIAMNFCVKNCLQIMQQFELWYLKKLCIKPHYMYVKIISRWWRFRDGAISFDHSHMIQTFWTKQIFDSFYQGLYITDLISCNIFLFFEMKILLKYNLYDSRRIEGNYWLLP